MIKARKRFLLVMLALCLVITEPAALPFAGMCNRVEAASSIKLSKTTLTLKVKGTATLKVTGTTKTVKWSSSDKSIATVKNGKVTAKKAGKATITAKAGTEKLTCAVTVKEDTDSGEMISDTLTAPRIKADSSMASGQRVIWDCVWFGSYPQAEVVPSGGYTSLREELLQNGDVIVSDSIFNVLNNSTEWDSNDEIILDGIKYRKMRRRDATNNKYTNSRYANYYKWEDSTTYHYFKYEPIKWRILCISEGEALLLSDIALDGQEYFGYTWENSVIRKWLNGYESMDIDWDEDLGDKYFLNYAFTDLEQSAIITTPIENADNIADGTEGGNDTTDKIFLLSESEVWYTNKAVSYGFAQRGNVLDEARRCKSSTYAKAMGIYNSPWGSEYVGNCEWWLRSPGAQEQKVMSVGDEGDTYDYGYDNDEMEIAIRPALTLNLSYTSSYSYAGTVCSNGTVSEVPQGTQKIAADGKILGSTSIKTTTPAKKTISKLNITAKAGKKKITIKTAKGAKVKVTLNKKYIKKGKKLVKTKTITAKKNKNGKVIIKLGRKLVKGTKITVTVSKTGYKTKKKTKKLS